MLISEVVATAIHEKMLEDGLPIKRMVTLVRDGPKCEQDYFLKDE